MAAQFQYVPRDAFISVLPGLFTFLATTHTASLARTLARLSSTCKKAVKICHFDILFSTALLSLPLSRTRNIVLRSQLRKTIRGGFNVAASTHQSIVKSPAVNAK